MLWKDLAASVEEFRRQKQKACRRGWGDSGPIPESRNLQTLTRDLADQWPGGLRQEKCRLGRSLVGPECAGLPNLAGPS